MKRALQDEKIEKKERRRSVTRGRIVLGRHGCGKDMFLRL
jgi:hypothetical protein